MIEQRKRWHRIDKQWSFFETEWKPKSWDSAFRFIFTRKKTKKQHKGPMQLHLFEPRDFNYDYDWGSFRSTGWNIFTLFNGPYRSRL